MLDWLFKPKQKEKKEKKVCDTGATQLLTFTQYTPKDYVLERAEQMALINTYSMVEDPNYETYLPE